MTKSDKILAAVLFIGILIMAIAVWKFNPIPEASVVPTYQIRKTIPVVIPPVQHIPCPVGGCPS